ncbi:MAG: nitroreductase family protein [Pseudomonas sp.]
MSWPSEQVLSFVPPSTAEADAVLRKALWRLPPLLLLGYVINTIDCANVAFAKLSMAEDIAPTDAACGIGAGSFLDLGMFVQTLMLAARARGLHTCAQAAFAGYHQVVRAHVPLPAE